MVISQSHTHHIWEIKGSYITVVSCFEVPCAEEYLGNLLVHNKIDALEMIKFCEGFTYRWPVHRQWVNLSPKSQLMVIKSSWYAISMYCTRQLAINLCCQDGWVDRQSGFQETASKSNT